MVPEALEIRERELRRAVERHQFEAVDSLIASFCGLADEHIVSFPRAIRIVTKSSLVCWLCWNGRA